MSTQPQPSKIESDIVDAIAVSRGHFLYESGHHGDLWLDLDELFVDARRARGWTTALTQSAMTCRPEIVCGPLTGGALVAQSLAAEIGAGFVYTQRITSETGSVRYRVPDALRAALRGKRVLLVDDAINAGSAVRSTLEDVLQCGGEMVGLAALITLGDAASVIARERGVPLFALVSLSREMWTRENCPLCSAGVPLVDRVVR